MSVVGLLPNAIYDPSNGYVCVTDSFYVSVVEQVSNQTAPPFIQLLFVESGLPKGTWWSVSLRWTTEYSNSSNITIEVSSVFTQIVLIRCMANFHSSGIIKAINSSVSVNVNFNKGLFPVRFVETGLPNGIT